MLWSGNLGLKMGVSRVAHLPNMHYNYGSAPPGLRSKRSIDKKHYRNLPCLFVLKWIHTLCFTVRRLALPDQRVEAGEGRLPYDLVALVAFKYHLASDSIRRIGRNVSVVWTFDLLAFGGIYRLKQ